jgi:hypothetical protein
MPRRRLIISGTVGFRPSNAESDSNDQFAIATLASPLTGAARFADVTQAEKL